jgi:hypothetical protein
MIKEFVLFIIIILTSFIVGPIFSTSYYYSIKSDVTSATLTSYGVIISITIGFIDSILYGVSLYSSTRTVNELYDQRILIDKKIINYHKHFQSIIAQQKQFGETIDVLLRTQTDLYDLIKEVVSDNNTDQMLAQNTRNKLTTLEFIQKDSLMTIIKNINKSLRLLKVNSLSNKNNKQLLHNYINNSTSNSYIFNRVYVFIFTFSFLQYIHQIVLWFFQYLTLKNPKKYLSYSLILSVIILNQSLGLIYFFHITNTFHFLSPLYVYTCIFFIRSLVTIYRYAFTVY